MQQNVDLRQNCMNNIVLLVVSVQVGIKRKFISLLRVVKWLKKPYPSAYVKELNNVILAGQWISLPGGLPGSAIAGKFAVQRICKKENMEYIF